MNSKPIQLKWGLETDKTNCVAQWSRKIQSTQHTEWTYQVHAYHGFFSQFDNFITIDILSITSINREIFGARRLFFVFFLHSSGSWTNWEQLPAFPHARFIAVNILYYLSIDLASIIVVSVWCRLYLGRVVVVVCGVCMRAYLLLSAWEYVDSS